MTGHPTMKHSAAKPLPRLLSIKQALFELGIGRTLFYELLADEKIVSVTIGRRRFIPRESIDDFIASLQPEGRA
jgi:excisionase family DNA binding protein